MTTTITLTLNPNLPSTTPAELEDIVLELKSEIEHASSFAIPVSETQVKNDGTLGPEWVPVLTAILAAPVAVEAVKGLLAILGDWLNRRTPVSITVDGPKGRYVITASNMSGAEIQQIAEKLV